MARHLRPRNIPNPRLGSSYICWRSWRRRLPLTRAGPSLGSLVGFRLASSLQASHRLYVGSTIDRLGGRPVLAASAILIGLGQLGLGLSESVPVYIASWLVMGLGMGAGLYDAAFGTLGRLYGQGARSAITTLTLFGGFASTACWPLSAYLVETLGWRATRFTYAAIQIGVSLPLYVFTLPREGKAEAADTTEVETEATSPPGVALVALLAITLTLAAFLSSTLSMIFVWQACC